MKRMLLLSFCTGALLLSYAQSKKTVAKKPAPTVQLSAKTPATGGINQNNYGKVAEYLNKVIDCMNSQNEEIAKKHSNMDVMGRMYATNNPKKNEVLSASAFNINMAMCKGITNCAPATPPAMMGAADVAFFAENYQALNDNFIKLAIIWNDISTHIKGFEELNLKPEEGKAKYNELVALEERYFSISKKLNTRHTELQKQLFPYSVAKSPFKQYYTNIFNDMWAVKDFSILITDSYEDIMSNKETIAAVLKKLESEVTPHMLQRPQSEDSNMPNYYSGFYTMMSNYIRNTKELLNNKDMSDRAIKRAVDGYDQAFLDLIKQYNEGNEGLKTLEPCTLVK